MQIRYVDVRQVVLGQIEQWRRRQRRWRLAPEHLKLMRSEFDAGFYISTNPDIAELNVDPFEHYVTHGWLEGRDPAPWFSTSAYLADHPDVRAQGINPFLHFLAYGRGEGRKTVSASEGAARQMKNVGDTKSATAGTSVELSRNAMLRALRPHDAARILVFFRRLTTHQSRPSWMWSFDPIAYLLLNPDIAASNYRAKPARHFDLFAKRDRRLHRPQDVVDTYFGNTEKFTLEFTSLARAFLHQLRTDRRRDPFECATQVLSNLGQEQRRKSVAYEYIKLRTTYDQSFPLRSDPDALRTVTVACHLYYTDEIDWIGSVCDRFAPLDGLTFQYVFSLSESKATAEIVETIRRRFSPCSIYLTENRGHDLGAILSILRAESFPGSEWLVMLHGKKSTQNDPELVRGWKQALADSVVAGLTDIDRRCKSGDFTGLSGVGGYFASSWRRQNMGKNGPAVTALRKHFRSKPPPDPGVTYLSGSMLVTRMSVWREIAELTRDCVFSETGKLAAEERTDGLLEHAVERIVQEVAAERGLTCIWN